MTKSAHTRASLLPYPIIAAAVAGDAEAVSRVVRHYSSYIAALSTRTSYMGRGSVYARRREGVGTESFNNRGVPS